MKYQVTTIGGSEETKLYREIDASILPPREGWYLTNLGDTQLAWIGDGVNGDGPNKELMWCSRGRGHVNKWYEAVPLQSKQDEFSEYELSALLAEKDEEIARLEALLKPLEEARRTDRQVKKI